MTSFLGRERELQQLDGLLARNRLVTLTGPGGTGKTSLAIEAARAQQARFADNVWFVALDGLPSAALVAPTAATALGLLDVAGVSASDRLVQFMRERRLLLVLDNFEHLTEAAPLVADLLQASAGLTVLVTSRAPLHLASEREFPVGPLALPAVDGDATHAGESDAVRLFVERARLVRPGYSLPPSDVQHVTEICRRLDGLPLAIELAASRMRFFSSSVIAQRLGEQLDLPGPGIRDLPARQQGLEQVVAWSYDLLEPAHRQLLRRLSVFAGGCGLREAERVCAAGDGMDILDGVAALVDQSLLIAEDGPEGLRYRLLETIRAYAQRALTDSGELSEMRRRHALAYRDLAEAAAEHLPSRDQREWLDRLSADHDNLRAAIRWAIEAADEETALRLGAALWRFWQIRGHVAEGRRAIEEILTLGPAGHAAAHRVWALAGAGGLSWWANEIEKADAYYAAQLELARALGDRAGAADALFNRAWPQFALHGEAGLEAVADLLDQAAETYVALTDERALARVDNVRAGLRLARGSIDEAIELLLDVVHRHEQFDDDFYAGIAADSLAAAYMARGDLDTALRWQVRSMRSAWATGNVTATTFALPPVFVLLSHSGLRPEAATIDAAYESLRGRYGVDVPIRPEHLAMMTTARDSLQEALPAKAYASARARGASMSLDDAVGYVSEVVAARERGERHWGEVAAEPVARSLSVHGTARPADRLIREGDVWAITFESRTFRLRDAKGLRYLAQLLTAPGREIPALDLAASNAGGQNASSAAEAAQAGLTAARNRGEVLLDAQARAGYRARLLELKDEIDEAERFGDVERASRSREEFEYVARELAAATGLGDRPREVNSAAERARISVTKAVHGTIDRMRRQDRTLAEHLERSVHTGRLCTYSPDPGLGVSWVIEA